MYAPRIQMITPKEWTLGRVLKYTLLPGIIPRLQSLAGVLSKFMFSFTQVFGTVGLIDRNHPCLHPGNIGRYRFFDILGLAFYGLLQDRKNLNKVLVFAMTIITIVMVMALAAVSLAMVVSKVPEAHAQLTDTYFTDTQDTNYDSSGDIAYIFLSEVFGNTGMNFWGNSSPQNGQGLNDKNIIFNPILRAMFSTYSQALLIIAILMIIYNIVVMVAESARTGQPFGENFNSVWAPVRLALAIGLLAPISGGYNTAQLLTFQVSAWGSALATNVWTKGLSAFGSDSDQAAEKLLSSMQPSNGYRFMRGLFLTNLCYVALNRGGGSVGAPENIFDGLVAGGVRWDDDAYTEGTYRYFQIGTYLDTEGMAWNPLGMVISMINPAVNSDYCGGYKVPDPDEFAPQEIKMIGGGFPVDQSGNTIVTPNDGLTGPDGMDLTGLNMTGSIGFMPQLVVQRYRRFYEEANKLTMVASERIVDAYLNQEDQKMQDITDVEVKELHQKLIQSYHTHLGYAQAPCPTDGTPCNQAAQPFLYLQTPVFKAAAKADAKVLLAVLNSGKKYGWASAGSIMMMLAHMNNIISSAVNSPPTTSSLPRLLTNPLADPWFRNESVTEGGFNWWGIFGDSLDDSTKKVNKLLAKASTWFADRPTDKTGGTSTIASDNNINMSEWRAEVKDRSGDNQSDLDMMASSGMQSFLLSFVQMDVANMNPLGQIVAIGSGLFTVATVMIAAGLIANIWLAGAFSLAFSLALPLIIGAYMLCVVLPFALFANFMFAVIEWVVSVFEAVVGMPLFALSFISVSGEGVGDKAMGGVMKLVELMLRPSIIVISTVGAMLLFAGAVHFFNRSFMLFMQSYFDSTDGALKNLLVIFGSVFMYVMTVYTIGNSCFKVIPTIANNFMRWIDGPTGFSGTMDFKLDEAAGLAALVAVNQMAGKAGAFVGGKLDKMDGMAQWDKKKAEQEKARDRQNNARVNSDYQANEDHIKDQYQKYQKAGGKDNFANFRNDSLAMQRMNTTDTGGARSGGYGASNMGYGGGTTGAIAGAAAGYAAGSGGGSSGGGAAGGGSPGSGAPSGGGSSRMSGNVAKDAGYGAGAPTTRAQYDAYRKAGGKDDYQSFAKEAREIRKMDRDINTLKQQFDKYQKSGGKASYEEFEKKVQERLRRNNKDSDE